VNKILGLIVLYLIANLSYANFLNSVFTWHKKPKHKAVIIDYSDDATSFKRYCNMESTVYGYQIKCITQTPIVTFKPDASTTVKCAQMVNGIGNDYLPHLNLEHGYIKTLAKCKNTVYGPNILQTSKVSSSGTYATSSHQTTTYYDIVCDGNSGYDKTIHVNEQKQYIDANNLKIHQCIDETTGTAKSFILMFEICAGLAILALGIFIYKTYYRKKP
jgi:hypothetical protein